MSREELEELYPGLRESGFEITSEKDYRYNCIAWAVGDTRKWWEPSERGGYYWPPGVKKEYSLESYAKVFVIHGYEPCETDELEADVEKVALYVDDLNIPSHAAKQKADGVWMSKLGEVEDIEHPTLSGLEGEEGFGTVKKILKRQRRAEGKQNEQAKSPTD